MVYRSISSADFFRFLFLAVSLASCGTLSGLHETVSVTTRADPVLVNLDDEPNFFAPDFIRLRRGRSHSLELIDPKTKATLAAGTVQCGPRWIISGLGNGVLTFLSPPLGLAAFTLDILDGAAFDCRGILPIPQIMERIPKPRPTLCPTYLVAPPGHADVAISQHLAAVWIKAKGQEANFCGHFVDPMLNNQLFNYLNISNLNAATFATLSRSQANILGYESKANHLVVLRHDLGQGSPLLQAEIIDLHTLERHRDPPIRLEPKLAKTLLQSARSNWLLYSISLVPNTIMYGTSWSKRLMKDGTSGAPVTSAHERGMLPKAITSLALGSLNHPMGYDEWDTALRFYPTMYLNYWNVQVSTPSRPSEVKYQAVFVNFPYNAEISIYTPVGTFGLAVAGGPMPTWTFENKPKFQLLWSATKEINWTVFTSRDIFMQLVYEDSFANAPVAANGVSVKRWSDVSLRLGYFTDIFSRTVQKFSEPKR